MTPTVKDHVMPLTTADLRKICDALKHDHERKLFVTQAAFRNAATPARVRAMLDEIDALTARAEAAEALVKEAGEALRPFAVEADDDIAEGPLSDLTVTIAVAGILEKTKPGHYRAARAFLAKMEKNDER